MTPLTERELSSLRREFPDLPEEYFRHLAELGWGEAPAGTILYSGPIAPAEVYGEGRVQEDVLLLGDDTQGYCLAFHRKDRRLGEISPRGQWEPWPEGSSLAEYVSGREE